jgi:ribonuclease Y
MKTTLSSVPNLAQKMNEDERVVNGIAAHHNDVEPKYPESILVQIADAISASRPGARRETLDNYIKRLEGLETIGESFDGVDKCFAIQAGREVRIMVNNDEVDDRRAKELAKRYRQENRKRYEVSWAYQSNHHPRDPYRGIRKVDHAKTRIKKSPDPG